MHAAASAVKALAERQGLDVYQPPTLREPQAHERLRALKADAMIVAAYGLILPPAVLAAARHGAINIHASLLPRWRGAAPIQRALLAGDTETGVSIMKMDAGLDTGPVYSRRSVAIGADDDSGTLHDKLAALGADLLLAVLDDLAAGRARAEPQASEGVTYAHKIDKAEAQLRWERPAAELERAVRAFRPAPGATTRLGGDPLKVWRARVVPASGEPGVLLSTTMGLTVACGRDALQIDEVQPAGGRRMSAAEFARGRRLAPGTRLQ
jgi:methionyl-tRNA formyltransferase